MDKIQEINTYITKMKIKKTLLGGYDREDVYMKISELVDLFQKCLEEIQEDEKSLIEGYEKRLQASNLLISELNKEVGDAKADHKNADHKNAVQEKENIKNAYKDYCSNILQRYSESLRSLSAEFSQILDNVTKLQDNIVNMDLFETVEEEFEKNQQIDLSDSKMLSGEK